MRSFTVRTTNVYSGDEHDVRFTWDEESGRLTRDTDLRIAEIATCRDLQEVEGEINDYLLKVGFRAVAEVM